MHATPQIDRLVQQWIAGHRVAWIDRSALLLTELGGTPIVLTVTVIVGLVAWRRTRRWSLLVICIAAEVGVEVAARLLKVAVDRPRPPFEGAVVVLANSSLPAAHVARALYAGCLICAVVESSVARRRTEVVVAAVVAVVAGTRVVLGAHWLTDTLAAVPLALLAAALPVWLLVEPATRTARPPSPAGMR